MINTEACEWQDSNLRSSVPKTDGPTKLPHTHIVRVAGLEPTTSGPVPGALTLCATPLGAPNFP